MITLRIITYGKIHYVFQIEGYVIWPQYMGEKSLQTCLHHPHTVVSGQLPLISVEYMLAEWKQENFLQRGILKTFLVNCKIQFLPSSSQEKGDLGANYVKVLKPLSKLYIKIYKQYNCITFLQAQYILLLTHMEFGHFLP